MLKWAFPATVEDLQRKLTARMETTKKKAAELMKIAAQSRKEIRELFNSAEKQLAVFTNSKDLSDQGFLEIALNLGRTENLLVLLLSKSKEDASDSEVIQVGPPDSEKTLLNHLHEKLRSILQYFQAEEKELSGMEEEISKITTKVSQLDASIKNFTGTRSDQFNRYSEKSQQLFGLEAKLERVSFKLVEVSSTLEKFQSEDAKKEDDQENNTITEKTSVRENSSTSISEVIQDLTDVDSTLTSEEEVTSTRSEEPNEEVLRELRQLQIENMKNDLGVFSGFSLPPGSYPSLNVFYTEGTPSRFWLTIATTALGEFNSLIKVFSFFLFVFPGTQIYLLFRSH